MPGLPKDGGKKLIHRRVDLDVADGVSVILEANPARLRVQMFNDAGIGSACTVYVGNYVDVDAAALAAANGWPLLSGVDRDAAKVKEHPNLLTLYTKDTVYGIAIGADGYVKMIEELIG